MKATVAVLQQFAEPLSLEHLEIPKLAAGQILVQIEAAGVCGSDVHMWQGKDPRTPLPMVLGHEGVGRIVEAPLGLRDIHGQPLGRGDRIIWERGVTCGRCYYCTVRQQPELCTERWVYGIYRGLHVAPHLNGCYATHLILDAATHLIALSDEDDPAIIVPASCSGATAAHALELTPAQIGDTVVIFGPGPLGAFCVALARAAGAEQIVVIGGTSRRLELCSQMGATHALDRHAMAMADRQAVIMELTHGRGADLVVEASGSVAASREGLAMLRHGGALSLVGFGTPVGEMTFPPFESVVRKNVRIQGVWVSHVRHTERALALIRQQPKAFAELITHRLPLEEATTALETVAQREAMKVVLEPGV
ncbi:MAG: zinc-binding dehydrogenase [Anaerolineae bacterium]|nr:zinc-binding dehydrogenase [Anaerolineae bacterium]